MSWTLVYTPQALKDVEALTAARLRGRVERLLERLKTNPYHCLFPRFEKLCGDLEGALSRRINGPHRLIYQVLDDAKTVKIIRMWMHSE